MKEYIVYKCKICGKHTILLGEEVTHSENESKYITCGHDGRHKRLIVTGAYDSIKEVMDNHVYVKEGRRMRQIK